MIFLVKGDAMKVVSGHVTAHRSRENPSNVQDGGIAGTVTKYCVTHLKCIFYVPAGRLLGFIMSQHYKEKTL